MTKGKLCPFISLGPTIVAGMGRMTKEEIKSIMEQGLTECIKEECQLYDTMCSGNLLREVASNITRLKNFKRP